MFEDIRDPDARMRAVTAYASQVNIDPSIAAKKSGKEMLRMANVYCDEKNYEAAYILYAKFITLFVERLPKHPDFKTVPPGFVKENKQKLSDVFPVAEILKKKLKTRYMEQEVARRELEKKEAAILAKKQEEERIKEEKRKQEEERKRKEEEEKANDMMALYGADMIKEQEEQFRLLQEQERKRLQEKSASVKPPSEIMAPTAPPFVPPYDDLAGTSERNDMAALTINEQVPTIPPPAYESVSPPASQTVMPHIPSRDLKPTDSGAQAPIVDRSTKPSDHFMFTGGTTLNKHNLKNVWVPAELMVKFLNLAQANTNQGVETGGFLFGKFAQGDFRITHLILPQQTGKSDSFIDQSDEDELFTIQDKYDVTQLGWIHTHPTQTAFLSSVDQHVQASFQCMLPESIAIVCSPKFQETGIFYLTPEYGLDYVRNCTGTGFHPHPSSPSIFEVGLGSSVGRAQDSQATANAQPKPEASGSTLSPHGPEQKHPKAAR